MLGCKGLKKEKEIMVSSERKWYYGQNLVNSIRGLKKDESWMKRFRSRQRRIISINKRLLNTKFSNKEQKQRKLIATEITPRSISFPESQILEVIFSEFWQVSFVIKNKLWQI